MSSATIGTTAPTKKVNLRTPEVMEAVAAEVQKHYRSLAVEFVRATGRPLAAADMTVVLAKAFGFCYGVERAIDLAYAAAKVFKDKRIFLLGKLFITPRSTSSCGR